VAPEHEDPLPVVHHHDGGDGPQAQHVVLPAPAVRLLDVDQPEVDPRVGVDLALAMHLPLHQRISLRLCSHEAPDRRLEAPRRSDPKNRTAAGCPTAGGPSVRCGREPRGRSL
jgi:hypothetical protein